MLGHGDVDLVVWPETMFRETLVTSDAGSPKPKELADMPDEEYRLRLAEAKRISREAMAQTAKAPAPGAPPCSSASIAPITGPTASGRSTRPPLSRDGKLLGYYDKMQRVMFGEYVPLADRFEWLQYLTPIHVSLSPGEHPAMFELGRLRLAPDICFESVLSHLIRGQVNELRAKGQEPNVLVSLTNDGWFWGSSELDMHLACAVFARWSAASPF